MQHICLCTDEGFFFLTSHCSCKLIHCRINMDSQHRRALPDISRTVSHRYISTATLSSIISWLSFHGKLRTPCPWDRCAIGRQSSENAGCRCDFQLPSPPAPLPLPRMTLRSFRSNGCLAARSGCDRVGWEDIKGCVCLSENARGRAKKIRFSFSTLKVMKNATASLMHRLSGHQTTTFWNLRCVLHLCPGHSVWCQ